MPNHSDHLWQKEIAEFRCELAANEMLHDRHDEARRLLDEALAANRKCVRATLLLGDLAAKVGDGETAIDYWKRVEQQNPVYLALAAEKLMAAHIQLGRMEQGIQLLRGWLERHPSLDLLDSVFGPSSTMAAPRRPTCWCATNCGAIRRCSGSTSCSRRRSWSRRRSAPRPGTDQEPDPQPHPPGRALPLRRLRLQGAPVLLALPRLRRLGNLPAAAHRRIRHRALMKTIPDTATTRILVVGDVMLDRYWFGEVSRISPEAPVPVVKVERTEERPGGAANVARNCAALGAR
jgi:tetratricopeptide (TPR) repeat protein